MSQLHDAAKAGPIELVRGLLDGGADVNERADFGGGSPLQYAAFGGQVAVVELLLARGANPNSTDWDKRTPLHTAHPDAHIIQMLLNAGADVNARDKDGVTPLGRATGEAVIALIAAHGGTK